MRTSHATLLTTLLLAQLSVAAGDTKPLPSLLLAAHRSQQQQQQQQKLVPSESQPPPSAFVEGNVPVPITFDLIAIVAFCDLLIYLLLPEGERFGPFAQRLPRIAWSVLSITFSLLAQAQPSQPYLALVLSLLTGASAATDLLFWVPFYAFTIEWQKCSGGLFTRRVCTAHSPWDKYLLFFLCLGTGVFYSLSAVHAYGAFSFMRDEQKELRMRRSFSAALEAGARER